MDHTARRGFLPAVAGRISLAPPELIALFAMLAIGAATYFFVTSDQQSETLLTPAIVAALMVTNLVPAMTLIVLVGSRIARARAARSLIGGSGRLHVRLVALFSLLAAAPTLLVAIFSSLLFQVGVDFWFSDRSRGMFENAAGLAEGYYKENQNEVAANTLKMGEDLTALLSRVSIYDPDFKVYYLQQVVVRALSESAIIEIGADGVARTPVMIDPDERSAEARISPDIVKRLDNGEEVVILRSGDRIEAVTKLKRSGRVYLYASRGAQVLGLGLIDRAKTVLSDYNNLFVQSQQLQLRFNIALYLGSLALLALAVIAAIVVADRIVRPLGTLVSAARTAAAGDLSVRVPATNKSDEIGILSQAFNSMAEELQGRTSDLLRVNDQLDTRRIFIETILSGVSSAVLSVDESRIVRLANDAAGHLFGKAASEVTGQSLDALAPNLMSLLAANRSETILTISRSPTDVRTVAAKSVKLRDGHVLTLEDITQQQHDQRRAAWADVARRIAHEIKNPLTPIQLAAERLQRRYGEKEANDPGTFRKLTATIVRQVGDMRRMVDEFSSFARMPKPAFAQEDMIDIVRKVVFLQEVAHTNIGYNVTTPDAVPLLVCDRRLLSQAFINILKNSAEAIAERQKLTDTTRAESPGVIDVAISVGGGGAITVAVADNGIGLPAERDDIVEPYVTKRAGGTGLGLAIVKKIVEDHFGDIRFGDSDGGGALVTITLHPDRLAALEGVADMGVDDVEEDGPQGLIRQSRQD